MTKLTWQQLGLIFGDQFKLTASEAATILTKEVFSHNWKHGKDKQLGMMWRDSIIVSAFTHVLEEEDILAKKVGRKNVLRKLYNDGDKWDQFKIIAGLKYKKDKLGYKTFTNDYGRWKKLKFFKNVWKKGKRTENKLHKRILRKINAADEVLSLGNVQKAEGEDYTKRLEASGEYERTPSGLRKIPK